MAFLTLPLRAYTDPLGFPPLPFGHPTQTVASVHGSNDHYTWWIDRDHPQATDRSNPRGTPQRPRATIPNPLVLTNGDVVQIRGGNYWGLYDVAARGTPERPVFIRGGRGWPATTNLTQVGQLKFRDYSSSNVIVENLHFTGLVSPARNLGAGGLHNIAFRNSVYIRSGRDTDGGSDAAAYCIGSQPTGLAGQPFTWNIVVLSNKVDWFGDWRSIHEGDYSGVYIVGNCSNVFLIGNDISHTSGDGIAGGANAANTAHHIYEGYNRIWECRENGIDHKAVSHIYISENILWGFQPPATNQTANGEAIVLHEQAKTNTWVTFNTISNCQVGVLAKDHTKAYVVGNRFSDIHWRTQGAQPVFNPTSVDCNGAAIRVGCMDSVITDNEIVNCDLGIQTSVGTQILRNAITNLTRPDSIWLNNSATGSMATGNIFSSTNVIRLIWRGTHGPLSAVEAAFPTEVHGNQTN